MRNTNFYEKRLSDLTDEEWEQICLKCGKCCMVKYYNKGTMYLSNQTCRYYDIQKGKCSCYASRFDVAKDACKKVSLRLLETELYLLPPSCAYRRLYEGKGLPDYHPLLTGKPNSVEQAGQTVKSFPIFSEDAQSNAILELCKTAQQQHWGEVRIMREIDNVQEKFKVKWIEKYPSPAPINTE